MDVYLFLYLSLIRLISFL